MLAKIHAWVEDRLPTPRTAIKIAEGVGIDLKDAETAFAPILKSATPVRIDIRIPSRADTQKINRMIESTQPSIAEFAASQGFKAEDLRPRSGAALEVKVIAIQSSRATPPLLHSKLLAADLARAMNRVFIGHELTMTPLEFYLSPIIQPWLTVKSVLISLGLRVVERLFRAMWFFTDKPYIKADPALNFTKEDLDDALSWFRQSDRIFQIEVSMRDAYPALDVREHLTKPEFEKISPILQAAQRVIHLDITQLLQPGQAPLEIDQKVYNDKLLAKLANKLSPDDRANAYVVISDNDRYMTLNKFRCQRVLAVASLVLIVGALITRLIFGAYVSDVSSDVPFDL